MGVGGPSLPFPCILFPKDCWCGHFQNYRRREGFFQPRSKVGMGGGIFRGWFPLGRRGCSMGSWTEQCQRKINTTQRNWQRRYTGERLNKKQGGNAVKCWSKLVEKYWRKLGERLVMEGRPCVFANWCLWKLDSYLPKEKGRCGTSFPDDSISKGCSHTPDKDTPGL